MNTIPDFIFRAQVPRASQAWEELAAELPKGAELLTAEVEINRHRAAAHLTYLGRKADGTQHIRKSTQYVSLGRDKDNAGTWLYHMFAKTHGFGVVNTFQSLIPEAFEERVRQSAVVAKKMGRAKKTGTDQ